MIVGDAQQRFLLRPREVIIAPPRHYGNQTLLWGPPILDLVMGFFPVPSLGPSGNSVQKLNEQYHLPKEELSRKWV